MNNNIDIVIPWVDASDPIWKTEKELYQKSITLEEDASDIRFRDMDNLRYVFRGIENNAQWVNHVYFITYGHLPNWLNLSHPKLRIINHNDYIPPEYLPTFSSHTIELNLHRIPGLSEKFVYFNDDIFLLKPTKATDFFIKEKPCDALIPGIVVPKLTRFPKIVFNSVAIINQHFDKKEFLKRNIFKWFNPRYGFKSFFKALIFSQSPEFIGFNTPHIANSYLKSSFFEVWNTEPDVLDRTCRHKFRNDNDVNQYLIRYWQLASGNFSPHRILGKQFRVLNDNSALIDYIENKKGTMVCINDTHFIDNYELVSSEINNALNSVFPYKCSFEK